MNALARLRVGRVWAPLSISVMCLSLCVYLGAQIKKDNLPRLPGASLLVGYPPASLRVTTVDNTWVADGQGDWLNISPSLARDGLMIGSARFIEMAEVMGSDGIALPRPRIMIATYSVIEKGWTDYEELVGSYGRIAISPDGSMLAFTKAHTDHPWFRLHLIDLKTGSRRIIPISGHRGGVGLSWSPDGRRIAYDMNEAEPKELSLYRPAIFVLDVETGTSTKIANGEAPAWSPSGEWIAYLDFSEDLKDVREPNRVCLVRPDGTGSRILDAWQG